MKKSTADAVVIGSGAGGGIAAKVLAEAGLSVVLLEKGSNRYPGLGSAAGMGPNLMGNDELKFVHRHFLEQDERIEPRTYRFAENSRTYVGRVNTLPVTVGGGTTTYDGNSPRCQQKDFRIKSLFGELAGAAIEDWPIGYDDLEPYYTLCERALGIQGEAGVNPYEESRSEPYPMAPGYPKYHSTILADGARSLGYHPFPTPVAINSRVYGNRPACSNCGFCGDHGCAIAAKGNTAVTVIRDALLTGRCDLRPDAFVYRLNTDASGARIASVDYIDANGDSVNLSGGMFVLAGNAIESARLCFLSANDAHPDGLGNNSGLVGRHLMFHNVLTAFGLFTQRTHMHRGRVGTEGIDDFNTAPGSGPADNIFGGGTIEFGSQLHPIAEAKNLLIMGKVHKEYMRLSLFREHIGVVTLIGEDPPVPGNRVDLDPTVRDVYGFPVARITYKAHENDKQVARVYVPKMKDILYASGAKVAFGVPESVTNGFFPNSKHLLGTLRMGDDPSASVTDRWGRFHDLDNLYNADGGVFVTSTGYNPTLTQQALAWRTAEHMVSGS